MYIYIHTCSIKRKLTVEETYYQSDFQHFSKFNLVPSEEIRRITNEIHVETNFSGQLSEHTCLQVTTYFCFYFVEGMFMDVIISESLPEKLVSTWMSIVILRISSKGTKMKFRVIEKVALEICLFDSRLSFACPVSQLVTFAVSCRTAFKWSEFDLCDVQQLFVHPLARCLCGN